MTTHKDLLQQLPTDFDWRYYIDNHIDLQRAGINSEFLAAQHYLKHGVYEQRQYKFSNALSIQQEINGKTSYYPQPDTQVVLFVQWYDDIDTEEYRLKCLLNNLTNKYIDRIHIFCEINSEKQLMSKLDTLDTKLCISFIDHRLSYSDWMEHANKYYTADIKILANSDIYFDNSLQAIKKQKFNYQTIYGITRKDLNIDGTIVDSHDLYDNQQHPTHPIYSQDCWIYLQPLRISNLRDINYKLGYNNCDRLFKNYLEKEKFIFINLYPEINAIHIDYRSHKNHKTYDLNENILKEKIININDSLSYENIEYYSNKLEAIALLVTGQEITNGQFVCMTEQIIQNLQEHDLNQIIAQNIDFKILVTQYNVILNEAAIKLKKYFCNVFIEYIDIPEEYDFYNSPKSNSNYKYGLKSGPNYCFFKVFDYLAIYNTTLFLECDCILLDNWLHRIYYYVEYSGQFWISGSSYDGFNIEPYHHIVNQHINGGTGLYATGNKNFINFINCCFDLLPFYVEKYSKGIPYDYCIYQIIEDYFNFDHSNRSLWQFIKKNYLLNNLIMNYSTIKDISVDISLITKKYSPAIIHKK